MPYVSQVYSIFGFSVPVDPDELKAMIEQNVEVDFVERSGGGFTVLAKLRYYETGQRYFEGLRGGRQTFTADIPDDQIAQRWIDFTNQERVAEEGGSVEITPVPEALKIARRVVADNLRDILGDPDMSDTALALVAAPYLDGSRDGDRMVRLAAEAAKRALAG